MFATNYARFSHWLFLVGFNLWLAGCADDKIDTDILDVSENDTSTDDTAESDTGIGDTAMDDTGDEDICEDAATLCGGRYRFN